MPSKLKQLKTALRFGVLDWLSAQVTGSRTSQASRLEATGTPPQTPPTAERPPQEKTAPASATPAPPWTLERLASKLGLDPADETLATEPGLSWARSGHHLSLPQETLALDLESPEARQQAWAELLGLRLALDTAHAPYEREREEAPAQVWRKEDVPELHGQRRPWLVPAQTIRTLEAHLGQAMLKSPWHDDALGVIYVMELGHQLHVLSEDQAHATNLGLDRIRRDARQGLFYDSYKVRPVTQERSQEGRLRIYKTVEGLGCSRLLLLPDFDYDAAMEHGMAMIPDRDTMIIAQPASGADDQARDKLKQQLMARAQALRALSALPLPPTLYMLTPAAITLAPKAP